MTKRGRKDVYTKVSGEILDQKERRHTKETRLGGHNIPKKRGVDSQNLEA